MIAALLLIHSASIQPQTKVVYGEYCTSPHQLARNPAPHGPGPLGLRSIYCQEGKISDHSAYDPMISPDGLHLAVLSRGYPDQGVLHVMALSEREASANFDTGVGTFSEFALGSKPLVQWGWNSRYLWAARQQRMRPGGGWAITPLRPVQVTLSGKAIDLPDLRHPAGSLDGLLWIGERGQALAQFGTRGGYYRPERSNPRPTYAIVNAANGTIQDELPLSALEPMLEPRKPTSSSRLPRKVIGTLLPDGRVRTLMNFHEDWILWTQGEKPQRVKALPEASEYEFTRGGTSVLLSRPIMAGEDGIVIVSCGPPRHAPCRPREPRTATVASLLDLTTGRILWTLKSKLDPTDEFPPPAVSPDSRFALVGLVPQMVEPEMPSSALYSPNRSIALVSLRDGKILQSIPAPSGDYSMGFSRGGKTVWVQAHGYTVLYSVK